MVHTGVAYGSLSQRLFYSPLGRAELVLARSPDAAGLYGQAQGT